MQRITLKDMQKLAAQRNGICLSEEYKHTHSKLIWQCEKGHIWEALPSNVKRGSWCPFCAGTANLTLLEMHELAKSRGGKCLSNRYTNDKTKLDWQCDKGHVWEAKPIHIKRGHWCPQCAGNLKLTMNDFKEIARKKGGECLSDTYINVKTRLKWRCKKGHIWDAIAESIKAGTWCPCCAGKHPTIEQMQILAENKNGKCLSEKYTSNADKLKWQCKEGHSWEASPNAIKGGHWCPRCAGHAKDSLLEMIKLAESRQGMCLSTDYINARSKLKWQCKEGHGWEAMPTNIKRGQWCPICSLGISERICRKYFETIFKKDFPKMKPKWLINPSGQRMELDGYCRELKLAFEYQGEQHYKENKFFHKTGSFKQQLIYDDRKKELCKRNAVTLIEVPYSIEYEFLGDYIVEQCKKNKVVVPSSLSTIQYQLFNIYSPEKLKEMQQIAKMKGGRCLSENYVSAHDKLVWQCEKGHVWDAAPSYIKVGTWCPHCGGTKKKTIDEMREFARIRGGRCLSSEYVGNKTKLKWQCEKGHIWQRAPVDMKDGSWCPYCPTPKKIESLRQNIDNMQYIAASKGGSCLSVEYINSSTKLKWQCKEGHIWYAIPGSIKQGHWCPHCAGSAKLTIDDMHKIAQSRDGKCLSEKYNNSKTKLTWQCKEGHTWEALPGNIKQGHWCPHCACKRNNMS